MNEPTQEVNSHATELQDPPAGYRIKQDGLKVSFIKPWFGWLRCVVPVVIVFAIIEKESKLSDGYPPEICLVLAIATYWLLLVVLNRTVISIKQEVVVIRHGPLPLRLGSTINCVGLKNIWTRVQVQKRTNQGTMATTRSRSYALIITEANGAERKVLSSTNEEQADYFKSKFRELLNFKQ